MKQVINIAFLFFSLLLIAGCRKGTPLEDDNRDSSAQISSPVKVISPVDSDEYYYGQELIIKWLPGNAVVNIALYRKTEYKLEIAENVLTNGQFIWIVPENIDASVHYRIKIIPRDNPDYAVYSDEFTIKGY